MTSTYVAMFARRNGHAFHAVGQQILDLYEGTPLDEVSWSGDSWVRISDLRDGVCDYIPRDALA